MGSGDGPGQHALRALPAVHELVRALDAPHVLAVDAARRAIDEQRAAILAGQHELPDIVSRARELLAGAERRSLRRTLNATGVILHTNLGRAPLAASARAALDSVAAGYSNLELDLEHGERGSRQAHVRDLLTELTGAEAALVVNNGAAAVLLAVSAVAGPGRGVIVSRGQLVEIGGGFRIPEVIAASGARLVEVGTTNRTRLADFTRAIEDPAIDVGAILRVHPSNFRTVGFVEEVPVEVLCRLGPPVIDDVGSGLLSAEVGLLSAGEEPAIRRSVTAGASLVCASGDKLLGGPQAGLIVGTATAVAAATAHPLARALRIDKLSLAALEATLRLYRDPERARREVPVLAMLELEQAELWARARQLAAGIGEGAAVIDSAARVGGGSLPLFELEGPAVALVGDGDPAEVLRALRAGEPPVIARIHDGRVVLDPRTLAEAELADVAAAARAALGRR